VHLPGVQLAGYSTVTVELVARDAPIQDEGLICATSGNSGAPRAAFGYMTKKPDDAEPTYRTVSNKEKGTGPGSAGQSGDTQGLSDLAEAGSESVEELVEEGQFFEAEVIGGVENAPDADEGEVRTKEVPEDDVPTEYLREERSSRE